MEGGCPAHDEGPLALRSRCDLLDAGWDVDEYSEWLVESSRVCSSTGTRFRPTGAEVLRHACLAAAVGIRLAILAAAASLLRRDATADGQRRVRVLGLSDGHHVHRRVVAVLTFLHAQRNAQDR